MQENGGCDTVRNEGKVRLGRRREREEYERKQRRRGSDRNEMKDLEANRELYVL